MKIDTLCVQGGYQPQCGEPRQVPIYQTTTFKYDTTEHMGDLFDLKASGYFYTRLANPTNDLVAKKIAALEGGIAAILTSSGQAASTFSILNICNAGDHVVRHEWKLGDIVEIEFSMPVVMHKIDHYVAFTRGPVLLARESRFADGDMSEPFRRHDLEEGKFTASFSAVRTPCDDIWMAFTATLPIGTHHENPEAALPTTVSFCDYSSAGNRWERDNYYRTWFPVEYGPAD